MRKQILEIAALAGLLAAMPAPAQAKHAEREIAVPVQSGYSHSLNVRRDHRPDHRYDRHYRHWRKHRHEQRRHWHKLRQAHELWHWYNDGRHDRFYAADHRRFHRALGYSHRDFRHWERRYRLTRY